MTQRGGIARQRQRRAPARWLFCAASALVLTLSSSRAAGAGDTPGEDRPWLTLSALSGGTQLDGRLADYQWDTRTHASWGAQALAGRGGFAAGLRFQTSGTTQDMSAAGVTPSPAVRLDAYEVVGRVRLAEMWANRLHATWSVGRMNLGYHPDHAAVAVGAGSPVIVTLQPIHEWISGAGIALERALADRWSLGVVLEYSTFALDTAHRSGAVVVDGRERFGSWNARLELARVLTWL